MSWFTREELQALGFRKLGRDVKISKSAKIMGAENISIGDNVRVDGAAFLMAAGEHADLILGSHIHIAVGAVLMAAGGIYLGDFTCVGINSNIISASDDFTGDFLIGPGVSRAPFGNVKRAKVILNDHAIITTGCTVLPGVTFGFGAVLGAMSLATRDLKDWHIHAGCPARMIKERTRKVQDLGQMFDMGYREGITTPSHEI